jgi:putative flippase GtrA
MIGSLIWIGNLRKFGYLSTEPDRFSIFSVLEHSMGEKGSSIISLFAGMFFAFYFSKIWTGWWLRGHGYSARTSKQVCIIVALSVYIGFNCSGGMLYFFTNLENISTYKFDENFDPERVVADIIMIGSSLLWVALSNVGVFFLARPWRNKTIDGVLVGIGDAEESIPTANLSVRR